MEHPEFPPGTAVTVSNYWLGVMASDEEVHALGFDVHDGYWAYLKPVKANATHTDFPDPHCYRLLFVNPEDQEGLKPFKGGDA